MMMMNWLTSILPIAAIYIFRMLGLFMLIPIFSVYGQQLNGASPIYIGMALGAYGFSQGVMQMPFGILSDYWGRKPLLYIGLGLFFLGSLLGVFAHSIFTMILARSIQGLGAIGSVLIALIADMIPDQDRPKAMAVIGMSIATSFAFAMILSPIIAHGYGLVGIFQFTCILAMIGLLITVLFIPKTTQPKPQAFSRALLIQSFIPSQLLRCHIGIFIQHFILTSSFFVIPILLKSLNIPLTKFYLYLMLISFAIMLPLIGWAERQKKRELLFRISLFGLCFSQIFLLMLPKQIHFLWSGLFIYFLSFNVLEALFPSMLAKAAPQSLKGTASGIYSSAQFLGIFAGGICSGLLYQYWASAGIFISNGLLAIAFMLYALRAQTEE